MRPKRYLVLIVSFFVLGIAVGNAVKLGTEWWLYLACGAALVNVFLLLCCGRLNSVAWPVFLVLLGALWCSLSLLPAGYYDDYLEGFIHGEGMVVSYPRKGEYYTTFTLRTERVSADGQELPVYGKLKLKVSPAEGFKAVCGTRIAFTGKLLKPEGKRNPGEFDYYGYLIKKGIFYEVKCAATACTVLEQSGGMRGFAAAGREKVESYLSVVLPPEERNLMLALLFGDVGGMAKEEWEGYRRAGVLHLFAVSGFNVAFVLGLVWFFLLGFTTNRIVRLIWGSAVLLFFYYMIGWSASIVRASLTAFVGLLALAVGRKPDIYTGLAVAALVILLANPGELLLSGFQLSFAATIGIVYLTPWVKRLNIGKKLSVPLAAYLATLPLIAYHYNMLSLIAPFLNVIAVVISGLVIVLGFIASILTWTFSVLAEPVFLAAGALIYVFSRFVLWCAKWEGVSLVVASPSLIFILMYYSLLLVLPHVSRLWPWWRKQSTGLRLTAYLLAFLLVALVFWPSYGKMEVIFLDVGQGDSIFIRTPSGRTMLVDGGGTPSSDYSVGLNVVRPFLLHKGVGRIDALVMTHNDYDHSEGLLEILPYFQVGKFLMPPAEDNNEMEKEIFALCREKKIPIVELAAGEKIVLDEEVFAEVLHPNVCDKFKGNEHSLVLRLVYRQTEWLLTGDVENEAIGRMLSAGGDVEADVLKIPHHGGLSSFNEDFYQAVKPKAVVISVGVNNYNHPHSAVTEYFSQAGIPCYITKEKGAVMTESDGETIEIRTMPE